MNFKNFSFKKYVNDTLDDLHFTNPTSIQEKVIPLIKKHKNVIALAHTGTGKTHSFLLPILNNIDFEQPNKVQALIIVPTRELAKQIFENVKPFIKHEPRISVGLYIGGEDIKKDQEALNKKQPTIAIGTPTRLNELYSMDALKLTSANYVVVDECDMIFDLGFIEEVDFILHKMKKDLVLSFFSATINSPLQHYLKKYIKNSYFVDDSQSKPSTSNVKHILIDTKNKELELTLANIVKSINPFLVLIFVNNKNDVSKIVHILRKQGVDHVGEMHADLQPRTRTSMLKRIKNNEFKYVVATDVAARGVDIEGVTHVISINLPRDLSYYIHRSGRTGRNKLHGISYILDNIENKAQIQQLEQLGINFAIAKFNDGQLTEITPKTKKKKPVDVDNESQQVLNKYKNVKIKPGYKKKRKAELDQIKKKKRRKHIQESIDKIKKDKYKKRREVLFDE
ncbi:ATP-dependent RNA helicase [Williamsoniiplasma luminosum]|uniref:ATP-dependent RNA helicase n=1 Tax=Williamsoniiplasma luminosum TaxID=214888 RepID=A0A2K8NU44_9MOLU|nr:DEAD/DEAH box helicase [Williamsoniiplasma luminosum]ATZ17362.1 ATP-dependent RNA helicase [Williamsoniiplasma luminosum]